ncbi:hypothetical protein [Streptomyces microflavus]|uniref:hypothetical protein n=1 Tax=Streptomyces microflavus TaxID=1919 RepID=UPI003674C851
MDWGDAPAWAAIVVSAVAIWVSVLARRDGKRSADAAEDSVTEAKRSADAAETSVAEARRSGDAAERSAVAAEESLADQRREAEERRAAEEEAMRPRVVLEIEHHFNSVWHLVNNGTAPAENITCPDLPRAVVRGWEEPVSLPPGEVHEFMISAAMGRPAPTVLRLVWNGQEEPVPVRVPGRY